MNLTPVEERRRLEQLHPAELVKLQVRRFHELLARILPHNAFYEQKLAGYPREILSLDELADWPLTTKAELIDARRDNALGGNMTFGPGAYTRFHRTSGTHGHPMVVLDTAEDWQWWIETWQFVLDAAHVTSDDRAAMAFSFGPFIGFWSANDALVARGALVVPMGGMSSAARLHMIQDCDATIVCCTPSYALHLASVAAHEAIDLASLPVRCLIVAGEPGGSLPAVRHRIEQAWQAKIVDHAGATEVGPWGYGAPNGQDLHVVESEFIAEFLRPESNVPAAAGELSELVLTNLGRFGAPVIRYRTGDLVRPVRDPDAQNHFIRLEGGVLGRVDDMMIVRGVNVFPSAIEQILREFPEVQEYRMTVTKQGNMDALAIEVEDDLHDPGRISQTLQLRLGLSVQVHEVTAGTLPRFELKGKRFIDRRS